MRTRSSAFNPRLRRRWARKGEPRVTGSAARTRPACHYPVRRQPECSRPDPCLHRSRPGPRTRTLQEPLWSPRTVLRGPSPSESVALPKNTRPSSPRRPAPMPQSVISTEPRRLLYAVTQMVGPLGTTYTLLIATRILTPAARYGTTTQTAENRPVTAPTDATMKVGKLKFDGGCIA
jgi:hypothetical protein